MATIKISKQDTESIMVVLSGISATKLTLKQIVEAENIIEILRNSLGDFFEQRGKLVKKGEKFLEGYEEKLHQLFKKYGEKSKDPEVLAFLEESKKIMEEEINKPLRDLGDVLVEIDFSEDVLKSLKEIFSKEAFFGEKGYNDNEAGRAAFVRVIKALGIKNEELQAVTNKIEENKK